MKNKPIYLDYNATTPIDPSVAEAMRPFLDDFFGNPSSSHWYGVQTHKAVDKGRRQVAELINANAEEIVFTSGGSESNNYAIKGAAYTLRSKGNHIITSSIEHPAVSEVCSYLETKGFNISYLPVDEFGIINPDDLEKAITPQSILMTIMHANNETGSIQPIRELAEIAHAHGLLVHCDAAQSCGKIPVDVNELGVDLLSIAAHKFYGPKGIGALYIRSGIYLEKLIHGANHEQNLRAGTENVLEIVGLGKAAELAKAELHKRKKHSQELRDLLWNLLKEAFPDTKLNGHLERRLPNTLNVSFPNIEANTLLSELETVAASAGAACHAESVEISPVISAMNIPINYAMGTVRFSTGKFLSQRDIESAADDIISTIKRLKPQQESVVPLDFEIADIKLTHFTHGLGCACKLRPQVLENVLRGLPVITDPNVLVGTNTADDAAVYKLDGDTAIVQTVDFFTPIVDDPYHFGAIAAANALSDIYAMGAQPLFALNIVGFPTNRLPVSVLEQILKGASDKASEAGIPIIGGHTVDDTEPKFGMAVTGKINPNKIYANAAARLGDVLLLTKPIGTGIIATALKRGLVEKATADKVVSIMSALNDKAAALLEYYDVSAVTDVTGFGLLGHLKEMSRGSKVNVNIHVKDVPVLEEAWGFAAAGIIPNGSKDNESYVADTVHWDDSISSLQKSVLCDAQTSGGLLIAIAEKDADAMLRALEGSGIKAAQIGHFYEKGEGFIKVA
ncbi:MAG TPA: selenide, water dikinase SelD [Candidatus Marinimicrobia bacterium]|nr:selenide, water dikinase SelD [Candidatus Neomarinimicrobiota bacterium]